MNCSDLKGKRALVTGSTKHTGFAIAAALLEQGVSVGINGRNPKDVRQAAEALRRKANGGAKVVEAPGDIASAQEVDRLFSALSAELGVVDIMVNNACHLGLGSGFLDLPVEEWDAVLGVNLRGLFLCSQRAARSMAKHGGGVIVNLGSNTAARAIRHRTAYITTKGGIEAATRALALDLAPYNIRVNCIAPGYIHTSRWDALPADVVERRRSGIPLGAEAEGADIAQAVLFLACEASRRITGVTLVIDAGIGVQLLSLEEEQKGGLLSSREAVGAGPQ